MAFDANSVAAANAVGIKNEQFSPVAAVLKRKILLIGTYDPLKTDVIDNVPIRVLSDFDAASRFGFGSMLHRLAIKSFQGSTGIETFIAPQEQPASGVAAVGSILVETEPVVESGSIYLYIAGDLVTIPVVLGQDEVTITQNITTAINDQTSLPVTALNNPTAATNGFLTTGDASANLVGLQAISDGEFSIDVDGNLQDIIGVDFTSDLSLTDVAATLQTAIQGVFPGVTVVENLGVFTITSATTGATSTVSFLTSVGGGGGTDVSGTGFLEGQAGDGGAIVAGIDAINSVDLTAKSLTTYGNSIKLDFNLLFGQEVPVGLTLTATDLSGGSGDPDIQLVLNELNSNEEWFTDVVHGYGMDTSTLNKLSIYNGEGNDFVGLYDKLIARPFRSLNGDISEGPTALSDLITITDTRKNDRTNGVLAVPGSVNHPAEIAALAMGIMARLNNNRAEETQIGQLLTGVFAGIAEDDWTNEYDNRNTAVLSGISPTLATSEGVKLQNVVTFYRPDSVAPTSNGYRSQRNISIIQNLLNAEKLNFQREFWQGTTIVEDTSLVTNSESQKKARDASDVLSDLLELTNQFASNAWIYTPTYTISKLQEGGLITVRVGGDGFNSQLPVILSGEGGILNNEIIFDVSLAVLL